MAVQGLGNVGLHLCRYLHEQGAQLTVCDVDPDRLAMARRQFSPIIVPPEEIYDREVDVFASCAFGAILNDRTIPRLRARIICGGAKINFWPGNMTAPWRPAASSMCPIIWPMPGV